MALMVTISRSAWLPLLYIYLDVSETPKSADVIVVLGGGDGYRERFAALLFQEGYAPLILVSGHADSMNYSLDIISKSGAPNNKILINDQATSTYNEATQVLDSLLNLDVASALIVTNRFHTRRASAVYARVFADSGISLKVIGSDDGVEAENWWQSNLSSQILMEYPKMLYYWLAYGIWSG